MKYSHALFLFIGISLTIGCRAHAQQSMNLNQESSAVQIVGTWHDEVELSYRWEFTSDGVCNWYSQGKLIGTYSYSISDESPQCGQPVNTHPTVKLDILKLSHATDGNNCYEILGFNTDDNGVKTLSMRWLGSVTSYFLFVKEE